LNRAKKILNILKKHYGENAFTVSPVEPFRALIGCILSQRTRDKNASRAAIALFSVASTPQQILRLDPTVLRQLIRPSGYYNQKAKNIIGASKAIVERFGGVTPRTRTELISLPGVGPKTADIVLSYGFGEPAIAVDTHIHRVTKRLGLANDKASPADIKIALEGSLPRIDYSYTDGAILSIGKEYCKSGRPRCGECPLNHLCEKCGV
jgi:endonuclease III